MGGVRVVALRHGQPAGIESSWSRLCWQLVVVPLGPAPIALVFPDIGDLGRFVRPPRHRSAGAYSSAW